MKRTSYGTTVAWCAVSASMLLASSGSVWADFTFGTATLFDEPVNSSGIEYLDCISADGLEVYIEKPVTGGISSTYWDLYVSTRESINDPWSVPANLGPVVNSHGYMDWCASLSSDGLELYFDSSRPGGHGGGDIWVTKRPYRGADWGTPANLEPPINTSSSDMTPWITSDDCELYFSSNRPGGSGNNDIWVSQRASRNDPWQTPVNLGPVVNSKAQDMYPCLSPDRLVLFFSDVENPPWRPGGYGTSDMYMTRRKSIADPWEPPVNLGPHINTSDYETGPRVSPDGSVLYFTSSRPGKIGGFSDIWQAPIIPIVDFNGDGKVDGFEISEMANRWGTDDSLCDIGPMPWGDGVVNVEDLKVLAKYIGEPADDPTLVAHWALDETAGFTAKDSAGGNDGMVVGIPAWHPAGGRVNGALEFTGNYFRVTADLPLSPAAGPFSVLAWVQGGAPGQVILSQQGKADWLMADAQGALMTGLSQSERAGNDLTSEAIITDGNWHRIALTWDGRNLRLYVDSALVAYHVQDSLLVSSDKLFLGANKTGSTSTFFCGLIDDVRIYDRAVRP